MGVYDFLVIHSLIVGSLVLTDILFYYTYLRRNVCLAVPTHLHAGRGHPHPCSSVQKPLLRPCGPICQEIWERADMCRQPLLGTGRKYLEVKNKHFFQRYFLVSVLYFTIDVIFSPFFTLPPKIFYTNICIFYTLYFQARLITFSNLYLMAWSFSPLSSPFIVCVKKKS